MIPTVKKETTDLQEEVKRIECEQELCAYIQNLKYALAHEIIFQKDRRVAQRRQERYTNKYTVADFSQRKPLQMLCTGNWNVC